MLITGLQFKHITRNVVQKIAGVSVGVIGGYHGGNLGDMALGESVANILREQKIKTGLQTIYNLEKWPLAPFAIVGGGAVGYADSLIRVAKRYKGNYNKVALLGVDYNEKTYEGECLELIKNAAYLSCRSEAQAERMMLISGRKDITFHPDIAFSLYREFCAKNRKQIKDKQNKILLVNLIPLYGKLENGKMIPSAQYKDERPELYESFDQMHISYRKYVREVVSKALSEGYVVETIPFTPQDDEFGQFILEGLNVKHTPYHSDPLKMIRHMATAGTILATRYHATIFAIKLGIPLFPVAYAVKNELLLEDLGVPRTQFHSTVDLANGKENLSDAINVDEKSVNKYELRSNTAINAAITALNINN